jgi:heptaprenylglyceryl phosphate synthase
MILGAVEREQHAPAEPAEHVQTATGLPELIDGGGKHRVQQSRRGRVEHVADVIVTGDRGDAEQAVAIGVAMAGLELALMRQEGRALQEEH